MEDLVKSIIIKLSTPRLCAEDLGYTFSPGSFEPQKLIEPLVRHDRDSTSILDDFVSQLKKTRGEKLTFCELQAFLNTTLFKDFLRTEFGFLNGNFLFAFDNVSQEVFVPHLKYPQHSIYFPYVYPEGCGPENLQCKLNNFINLYHYEVYQKEMEDIQNIRDPEQKSKKLEDLFNRVLQHVLTDPPAIQTGQETPIEAIKRQYQGLVYAESSSEMANKHGVAIYVYPDEGEETTEHRVNAVLDLMKASGLAEGNSPAKEDDPMVPKNSMSFIVPAVVGIENDKPMCLCYASFAKQLDEKRLRSFLEIAAIMAPAAVNGPIAAKMQRTNDDMVYLVNIIKDFPHISLKYMTASMATCYKLNRYDAGDAIRRFVEDVAHYLQWNALKTLGKPMERDYDLEEESFIPYKELSSLRDKIFLFLEGMRIFPEDERERIHLWPRMFEIRYDDGIIEETTVNGLKGAFYVLLQNLLHNTLTKGFALIYEYADWTVQQVEAFFMRNCPWIHIRMEVDPRGNFIIEYYDSGDGYGQDIVPLIKNWIENGGVKQKQGFGFQTIGKAVRDLGGTIEVLETTRNNSEVFPQQLRTELAGRKQLGFRIVLRTQGA